MVNIFDKATLTARGAAGAAMARASRQFLQNSLNREAILRSFAEEAEARCDMEAARGFREQLARHIHARGAGS